MSVAKFCISNVFLSTDFVLMVSIKNICLLQNVSLPCGVDSTCIESTEGGSKLVAIPQAR